MTKLCSLLSAALLLLSSGWAQHSRPGIANSCKKEGEIAFTFDQGPSQYTGLLLTALAKNKVKATFHVSPDYLDNPVITAYLRRIANDGHLVGLFIKDSITTAMLPDYLRNCTSVLKTIINYEPNFLRFPVPGPSAAAMKIINGMGFRVTSYNLDSQDYNFVNDSSASDGKGQIFQTFKNTLDQILPPSLGTFISVQRDIVLSSVQQTDAIIKYAVGKGYKPVRLDGCIGAGEVRGSAGGDAGDDDDGKKKDPRAGGIDLGDTDDNVNVGGKTKTQSAKNDADRFPASMLLLVSVLTVLVAYII